MKNYKQFYFLFNKLGLFAKQEGAKEDLVAQFTKGRTSSLRKMKSDEYKKMCEHLNQAVGGVEAQKTYDANRKASRSEALRAMQRYGVDTTNWADVNAFTSNNRICGKTFGKLSIQELAALKIKVYAMCRKKGITTKFRR